jgi:hypothetical protein
MKRLPFIDGHYETYKILKKIGEGALPFTLSVKYHF